MDSKDFRLLGALYQNGRQSYRSLGRRVSLSAPAVRERLRRLERVGKLHGFGLWIDPAYLDRDEVMVFIPPERTKDDVARVLEAPEVAWLGWKLDGGMTVGLWTRDRNQAIENLVRVLGVQPSGHAFTPARPHAPLNYLDWQIIDSIVDDPRRPLREITDSTGLSPKTVRKHLDYLIESEAVSIDPRQGASEGAGELVYHVAVAGTVSAGELRKLMGDVVLMHQAKNPPMKYLLCRDVDLGTVTTKIRALGKLDGVETVNMTLNRDLLFGTKFIHSVVREKMDELRMRRQRLQSLRA